MEVGVGFDLVIWAHCSELFFLLSGLVDGHSHPVFAGDRVHEFAMKVGKQTQCAQFFHEDCQVGSKAGR